MKYIYNDLICLLSNGEMIRVSEFSVERRLTDEEIEKYELESNVNNYNI